MFEKPWSFAEEMSSEDISLMLEILLSGDDGSVYGRLALSGEIPIDVLGTEDCSKLLSLEEVWTSKCENPPLFIITRDATLKMLRFDPQQLWQLLPQEYINQAARLELTRLSVKEPVTVTDCDFYRSVVRYWARKYPECAVCADSSYGWYRQYLTMLLLLEKPGLNDVSVGRFFALGKTEQMLRNMVFKPLSEEQKECVEGLRHLYSESPYIFPEESSFVYSNEMLKVIEK
jgi:hypothetical protein